VFLRSIFPRWAIRASLSLPDSLGGFVGGGGGGGVVVEGTACMGVGVVKTGAAVEATGAAVVGASTGVSVNPVMMSSTTSTFSVVDGTAGAAVVMTAATVVGASEGAGLVVVSTCWGGAANTPAASSRGTTNMCCMLISVSCLSSTSEILVIQRLHSAGRVSGLL